jgi:hypothetical protein
MTDHWNGVDFTLNARPRNGLLVQGGTSTMRRSTNNCDVIDDVAAEPPPERGGALPTYNPGGVTPTIASVAAGVLLPFEYCDAPGTWLTQVKFLGSYTIPKVGVRASVSMQNLPGPEVAATYTATNAVITPSLGRPLAGGANNVALALIEPRSMYGDRMNQVDLRFSKLFRIRDVRADVGVDIYNAFNSDAILTQQNAYGAAWQRPLTVIQPRFVKFSARWDF